ncbi:MAG: CmpA/NrtA family ABC transporter substrate-binding protein [Steroidobacteraceae bacterium]
MTSRDGRVVTVGFMPLLDSALLVAAHEMGFAEEQGIRLRLVREVSWANLRDRVGLGHFDAAHMLGPMVVASNLLAKRGDLPLMAPVALGLGGNAITVSRPLWRDMESQGATHGAAPAVQATALARVVAERQRNQLQPLTLAMVFPFSCHNYQLRDWLLGSGIDPDRDVRLIVVPPPMLVEALRTGQVDGFCVGEPWNSLAVDAGLGTIVAVSCDIWRNPPEKVLGMSVGYIDKNPEVCGALVRAVVAASRCMSDATCRDELVRLLSQTRYVGAPEPLLRGALNGKIVQSAGGPPVSHPGFFQLNEAATVPLREHAQRFCEQIGRWRQIDFSADEAAQAIASFRPDLHAGFLGSQVNDARGRQG